jgi:hypothetical protein
MMNPMTMRRFALALILALGLAAPAAALEPICLKAALAELGPDQCPLLTRIKYPWLSCHTDSDGVVVAEIGRGGDSWERSRRIPWLGAWSEGNGYWGPVR